MIECYAINFNIYRKGEQPEAQNTELNRRNIQYQMPDWGRDQNVQLMTAVNIEKKTSDTKNKEAGATMKIRSKTLIMPIVAADTFGVEASESRQRRVTYKSTT